MLHESHGSRGSVLPRVKGGNKMKSVTATRTRSVMDLMATLVVAILLKARTTPIRGAIC